MKSLSKYIFTLFCVHCFLLNLGCASKKVVVEKITVPKVLLSECRVPSSSFTENATNEDFEVWVDDVLEALKECAESKRKIRLFLEKVVDIK